MAETTGSLADALKKDLEEAANAIFSELRATFRPEEGQGEQPEEDTNPESDDEEENDLTPENFLNEAVRLLQLAEDTASLSASGTYVAIADRYTYLAENF